MAHARRGCDEDAPAGDLRPPAQIEVLTEKRHRGIEPADGRKQISPYERQRAGHREHVAHGVVLLLVEFAALDRTDRDAAFVRAEPDLEEPGGVLPLDELRTDHRGIGAKGFFEQQANRVRIRSHVVVTEHVMRCALDDREDLVGGARKARVAAHPANKRVGRRAGHP